MNAQPLRIAAALAGLNTIAAVPAVAANHVGTLKLTPSFHRTQQYCAPPKRLENTCVAFGPAQPGALRLDIIEDDPVDLII